MDEHVNNEAKTKVLVHVQDLNGTINLALFTYREPYEECLAQIKGAFNHSPVRQLTCQEVILLDDPVVFVPEKLWKEQPEPKKAEE